MLKRSNIILFTIFAWIIGVGIYAYYWVIRNPSEYGQGFWVLPLLGFFVYRLPYLLIGLIILVSAELICIPGPHGRPGKMV